MIENYASSPQPNGKQFCIQLASSRNCSLALKSQYLVYFSTAGITLALFGGVRKHSMDQNKVPVRGDLHVIIVGMHGLWFLFANFNFESCL